MASKKVLIVDDEPSIIEIMGARLAAAGYEVCAACDGVEALEKVKSEKPNLIITDVLMPRMTGFEAMKKIRERPESKKIPAIVISAKSSMKDYFGDIPGIEFIAKPYDANELLKRVEALIGSQGGGLGASRRGILLGVEDTLLAKIRTVLSSLNFQIMTALSESDAFGMANSLQPGFFLCQYWEDENVLDVKKLSVKLAGHAELSLVPLYVFCKEALSIEAMKTFQGDRLITYNDTSSLLKKLEALFSKPVVSS